MFISVLLLFYYILGVRPMASSNEQELMLFDFSKTPVSNWIESSDTVREVGMSKASFVTQKTQVFQRAVFFSLLNPQPNGAGFAGVNYVEPSYWDLSSYNSIQLHARAQGDNYGYKIVLRQRNENGEPFPSYEQTFTAPNNKFETVSLPISNFLPYYRGRPLNTSDVGVLDTKAVSSFGLQIYGGVYSPLKQSGASSLEIDWIKGVK